MIVSLRSLLGVLFLVLIFVQPVTAQQYFDGKLIIKYKTENQLQKIRSQQPVDPRAEVQRVLQEAGTMRIEPVLAPDRYSALQTGQPQIRESAQSLSRIFEVSYTASTDARVLAAKLAKMPGIEYAEPKFIRKLQFTPNDPTSNSFQSYHRFIDAWDVTRGSADVVIAIVDGGVNYMHPDLDEKLWINTDEVNSGVRSQVDADASGEITSSEVKDYLVRNGGDFNGDGKINLADALADGSPLLTGNDTDGNDFADDIFGWDFWASGGVTSEASSDNDPILDGTDHGTHVAGIATAETNNGEGMAGAGFNSRYMALKAGGIPDDPTTSTDESRQIGFGYESIIYAATQGADIINCSWGGGGFSQFENDVIDFANDAGALVVGAAGNDGEEMVIYPSAYTNALSVGSVETSGQPSVYSNIGYEIDVFATGSGLRSTSYGNTFVSKSGTSMAAPVAAGLAGLVKALHPDWSSQRIATQIRASSTFLNTGNARLGHGILDASEAVSTNYPGLRIKSVNFTNDDGNKLGIGESGTVTVKVINYGRPSSNLQLRLELETNGGVTIQQPNKTIGLLATGDSTTVEFDLQFDADYDLRVVPTFRLNFSDNGQNYSDYDIFQYENILFDIIDANNVKTSFGGDGTIGFINPLEGRGGVGFIPLLPGDESFKDAENALFEGGLMIAANESIFDAVRATGTINKDFEPDQTFAVNRAGVVSAQDGRAVFTFEDSAGTTRGRVQLETFSFNDTELHNVVFAKYNITNNSQVLPMEEVYVGLFNDWDIGQNISTNSVSFSTQDSLLYFSSENSSSGEDPIVAVAHLGEISSALAINNFTGNNPEIDLGDGFSDAEKRAALTAGTENTVVSSADVSGVTATGPFTINPNATLTVGFIYAFGNDLETLRAQVRTARQQAPFSVSRTGLIQAEDIPDETDLLQNYPNPFRSETIIRLNLNEATDVKLTLYDVLGRKVRVIRDGRLQAQEHLIPFTPQGLSSGVYYLRLQTADKTKTVPMTYIK